MAKMLCWLGVLLGCSAPSFGRTIVVDKRGTGDTTEIQTGIHLAEDGDTVEVHGGEWVLDEPIDFRGKAITLTAYRSSTELRMSVAPSNPRRACLVFFGTAETEESVLEGFRLRAGPGYFGLGGAIYCDEPASPTIRGCRIHYSTRADQAVVLTGSARLVDCMVSDCIGTAVYCGRRSSPVLSGCRIQGNAWRRPGDPAVFCDDESAVTLVNCVVADNQGDGILLGESDGSTATLRCSTVAGNGGAGIRVGAGSRLSLDSSIVWGNGGEALSLDPDAVAPEAAFSCIETAEPWPGEGNLAADPLFASMPTLDWSRTEAGWQGVPDCVLRPGDYRLIIGSPAIDAGNPADTPGKDLDGNVRPCGEQADMGASEACTTLRRFRRGDSNVDGALDITDGLYILAHSFLCFGCREYPCTAAADADNNGGSPNITDAIYVLNFLFLGGPRPPHPGPYACGAAPAGSNPRCNSYPPCE